MEDHHRPAFTQDLVMDGGRAQRFRHGTEVAFGRINPYTGAAASQVNVEPVRMSKAPETDKVESPPRRLRKS
jgi:hypothetical protein